MLQGGIVRRHAAQLQAAPVSALRASQNLLDACSGIVMNEQAPNGSPGPKKSAANFSVGGTYVHPANFTRTTSRR